MGPVDLKPAGDLCQICAKPRSVNISHSYAFKRSNNEAGERQDGKKGALGYGHEGRIDPGHLWRRIGSGRQIGRQLKHRNSFSLVHCHGLPDFSLRARMRSSACWEEKMRGLHGSVGLGGRNTKSDVLTVQRALETSHISPGPLDGVCGRLTIQAIEKFQHSFLQQPDGRVDVSGPTWRRLSKNLSLSLAASRPIPLGPTSTPKPGRGAGIVARHQGRITAETRTKGPSADWAPATPRSSRREQGYWTMRTPLPKAGTVNVGLSSPSSSEQITRFGGMPSAHMSQNDSPITNPQLKSMIATESVGPFRVTGLRPAIVSLRAVLTEVRRDLPDLLALLSSAGMEVNRLQRGSRTKVSNHAWGSAIDLRVAGTLVPFGASYSLKGLDALVPYFNRAGWYWGGGYRSAGRADPMHFELGSALMKGITR